MLTIQLQIRAVKLYLAENVVFSCKLTIRNK